MTTDNRKNNGPSATGNPSPLTVINPDGTTGECKANLDAIRSAIKARSAVPICLESGPCLFVNEDGLNEGLEFNPRASELARADVVGAVVFVPTELVRKLLGTTSKAYLRKQREFWAWVMSPEGQDLFEVIQA